LKLIGKIYRLLHGHLLGRPSTFSWLAKGKVAGSGRPMSKRALEWIRKQSVRALLSLTEQELPREWVSPLGFTYLHLPIADHSSPPVEAIDKAVRFIQEQTSKNVAVAVHCNAGQGRTGTILAAYLVRSQGLKPDEAITAVRRVRPGSIERRQEGAVQDYFEWLHKSDS